MTNQFETLRKKCCIYHADRIEKHYAHACKKHPYFCDILIPNWMTQVERDFTIRKNLSNIRHDIDAHIEYRSLIWNMLLDCEVWEIHEAIAEPQLDLAVEEAYDAIAVLLRLVDVLEGRQTLGKPEEGDAK